MKKHETQCKNKRQTCAYLVFPRSAKSGFEPLPATLSTPKPDFGFFSGSTGPRDHAEPDRPGAGAAIGAGDVDMCISGISPVSKKRV